MYEMLLLHGLLDWNSEQEGLVVNIVDLISIFQGLGLKKSLDLYVIEFKSMLDIMMGCSTCFKWKNHGTLTWLKSFIHNRLMYLTRL